MPVFVQSRGSKFQLRVTHRNLPKPYFRTFEDASAATLHGRQLESVLERGLVPAELAAEGVDNPQAHNRLLASVIDQYLTGAAMTSSDAELLPVVRAEVGMTRVSGVTFGWADAYVKRLKMVQHLAPGTVRKRIGALARVLDWHLRRAGLAEQVRSNPLRMLGAGYSQYTEEEGRRLAVKKLRPKQDVHRDLRLAPDEESRVLWALLGGRREGRERALVPDPAFQALFKLTVDTGLRLSESYRLRIDQCDFGKGIIRVEGSKGARGVLKPRTVPMKKIVREELGLWCAGRSGLVFPFWDGTKEHLRRAGSKLSFRFRTLFDYAGVEQLTEHDLRHEACCRWVELRSADGKWIFSDVEVCKIMGWSSMSMMLRYASLRGEDLANRLL
jgi:integrase